MKPTDDDEKEIEATKAPLMEHLIELRSRLIKALIAFFITFIGCFFFAGKIYNVLIFPFEWVAGSEQTRFIYTALLEFFWTQLKLAMFGAAFISFPVIASQIYMFVAPGLYRHERRAFLPYLVATPIFFSLGATVVYFIVMPLIVRFSLGMQQLGGGGQAKIELLPKVGEYLDLMMWLVLSFGVAFQLAGHPHAARARRHPHLADAAREAALLHRRRVRHRRDPHPARRDQPALARAAADGALRGLDLVGAHRGEEGRGRGRREGGCRDRDAERRGVASSPLPLARCPTAGSFRMPSPASRCALGTLSPLRGARESEPG